MKKSIIMLVMLLSAVTFAQANNVKTMTATSFSVRFIENSYYGSYWTDWSRDMSCYIGVYFDASTDQIIIDSRETQVYNVYKAGDTYYDRQRNKCLDFKVIDQDGDRGTITLRSGRDWTQLYVRFSNVEWVYEVR